MPTILALDTATSVASCALLLDGELVGERTTDARSVLVAVDELLSAAGLEPSQLDGIVVGTGPGSFTSIRMGLSTVRGIALATGVAVAGVSTFRAFAGGDPVLDARRGEVFTAAGAADPASLDVDGRTLIGDGAVRYRDVFTAAGAVIPPADDPAHLPHAGLLPRFAGAFCAAAAVEPTYVRAPDAVPPAGVGRR